MGPASAYTLIKDRPYLISIYMDYVKLNPYLASKSHLLLIHTLLARADPGGGGSMGSGPPLFFGADPPFFQ